jgi:hypothetical protein
MNPDELDALIDGYLAESLDDGQTARLNAHLAASREAREEFRARIRIHADLADHFSGAADSRFEPILPLAGATPFRKMPWLSAAAAILIVGLTAIAVLHRGGNESPAQGVARIVASTDADWRGKAPFGNQALPAGAYELTRGSIVLLFTDGASVSVKGPATFHLRSARHLHLESGTLVARIPHEALGFTVTSPQSEVIDLGTEFGLSVNREGQTDVHVLDGLVEVLPGKPDSTTPGIMIEAGQARRFVGSSDLAPAEIPLHSRADLIGDPRHANLGVQMLRGSVRIADQLDADDLARQPVEGNWIDLIAEKQRVTLTKSVEVTLNAPGSYRDFGGISRTVPSGTRVNSYLLHFRPSSKEQVRGVIRFDQPIVGVVCNGLHLRDSDAQFGVPSVHYPATIGPRGLEPPWDIHGRTQPEPDWQPDEVILSQDRSTLSIHAYGNPENGYDQVRVLTLAPPQN